MFNVARRPQPREFVRRPPRPSPPPRRTAMGFINKILDDWSLDFSSLLAYNFIIALVPIAVTFFGIFALIWEEYPGVRQTITNSVVNSMPDNQTQNGVREVIDLASNQLSADAGGILAFGIIFAIFGGSRLFISIDKTLTIVYRVPSRSFLKQNLVAIGMLLLFIMLIPIMFAAAGAPSFLINALPNQDGGQFGIFCAGIAISISVASLLFFLIYFIIPNKKMKLKHIWCGTLIAAVLLDIFIVLFPLYIRRYMGTYNGLIGFAVILLLFFYYFSAIVILGAQINAYFFEHIQKLPEDFGTFFSQAAKKTTMMSPVSIPNTGNAVRSIQRPFQRMPRYQWAP